MASLVFMAENAKNHKEPAIEHSDFEGGFTSSPADGNRTNFKGSWICPANPGPYTRSVMYVSPTTQNTCVVIAKFSFDGQNGTIEGTMYVNEGATQLENSGIATAVMEATDGFDASTKALGFSAPYLMAGINEKGF
ncbi:MAG: hypothetical protein ACFHU9_13900 [Fluviicola sp.]